MMGNKIRPLGNILGCLPHARAQGDELGTKGDPKAANATPNGSSAAGCTGQSW